MTEDMRACYLAMGITGTLYLASVALLIRCWLTAKDPPLLDLAVLDAWQVSLFTAGMWALSVALWRWCVWCESQR